MNRKMFSLPNNLLTLSAKKAYMFADWRNENPTKIILCCPKEHALVKAGFCARNHNINHVKTVLWGGNMVFMRSPVSPIKIAGHSIAECMHLAVCVENDIKEMEIGEIQVWRLDTALTTAPNVKHEFYKICVLKDHDNQYNVCCYSGYDKKEKVEEFIMEGT